MGARARIDAAVAEAVDGGLPGVVVAARLPGGEVVEAAAGVRGLGDPAPMTPDTVFWIASFTKAITTAAALQLVEDGRIGLDDPVGELLPTLAAPKVLVGFDGDGKPMLEAARAPITLRHLLTHSSGHGYEFCSDALTRYVEAMGPYPRGAGPDAPLLFEPGSGWTYGIATDWTGQLIAAATGEGLDAYLERRIFAPLGMGDTGFGVREDQRGRCASMHARGADGALATMAFDMPPAPHFGMGGGGLYSTAADYLKFLGAILAGGGPILSAASVASMSASEWEGEDVGVLPAANPRLCAGYDPFPGASKRWGLGFLINPRPGPDGRSADRWRGPGSPTATTGPIPPPAWPGCSWRSSFRSAIRPRCGHSRRSSGRPMAPDRAVCVRSGR